VYSHKAEVFVNDVKDFVGNIKAGGATSKIVYLAFENHSLTIHFTTIEARFVHSGDKVQFFPQNAIDVLFPTTR
jgi:hypothetical protein